MSLLQPDIFCTWLSNTLCLGKKTKFHVGIRVLQQTIGAFSLKAPTDSAVQSNPISAALPIAIEVIANKGKRSD